MSVKSELQNLESACATVADWLSLAQRALEEPVDRDYAVEVAGKAEMNCQEPADYVALATFYVRQLTDQDYAEELLEQAEDACFDTMEYAEVGGAYVTLINRTDKGIDLIKKSADSASEGDLLRLVGYAENAGDNELAAVLLNQATQNLKEFEQFLERSRELSNAGSIEAAQTVLKSAARHIQTVTETVQFAAAHLALFADREQVAQLLENAELDCQFPADYVALAKGFVEILAADEQIDELLAQAADVAMEGVEFLEVAYGYLELKNDTATALINFKQAVADISERSTLQAIAKVAATQLNDVPFARVCYEKIAAKLTTPSDLVKLAADSWDTLQDPEYTKQQFIAAKNKMANASDLATLAEAIMRTLNDQEWVRSIFVDAGALVDSFAGLERLLTSQQNLLNDATLTLELLTRMQSLAANCSELITIFNLARDSLPPDADFYRSILSAAEDLSTSPADLQAVITAIQVVAPDEEEWLAKLTDKLARRQANQAKYAEIEAQQKLARSSLSFMRLAKRAVAELDDASYARTLLNEARGRMTEPVFDVSLWLMAIDIAASDLDDIELVQQISSAAATACTHFSSAFILVQKLHELLDESVRGDLIRNIFSTWETRLATAADSIKLAKAVLTIAGDPVWVNRILDALPNTQPTVLELIEIAELAMRIGAQQKAQEFYLAATDQCQNMDDLSRLINRLQTSDAGRQQSKDIYRQGGNKCSSATERLRWVEGILLHFNDLDWARTEYDQLGADISDDWIRAAYLASRRQHLEKKFFF